MTNASIFANSLKPIVKYRYSGMTFRTHSIELQAQGEGSHLTIHGTQSGFLNTKFAGTMMTSLGSVSFEGNRNQITGKEQVHFHSTTGSPAAQMIFPRLFGVLSLCGPATLTIGASEKIVFEIWKPSVSHQETLGRFRMHGYGINSYRLFSNSQFTTVFDSGVSLPRLTSENWLLLLAGLFYFCMHPEWVLDRE